VRRARNDLYSFSLCFSPPPVEILDGLPIRQPTTNPVQLPRASYQPRHVLLSFFFLDLALSIRRTSVPILSHRQHQTPLSTEVTLTLASALAPITFSSLLRSVKPTFVETPSPSLARFLGELTVHHGFPSRTLSNLLTSFFYAFVCFRRAQPALFLALCTLWGARCALSGPLALKCTELSSLFFPTTFQSSVPDAAEFPTSLLRPAAWGH